MSSDRKVASIKTGSSEPLTRNQVAEHLGVSISTVRRMEGRELTPATDARGVRRFDVEQVARVAEQLRAKGARPTKRVRRAPGDLAAEIFERFEQRYSLSEIVRELRVEPKKVRRLYHEWRTSLDAGEQVRKDRAVPWAEQAGLDHAQLEPLLKALPEGQPIRISVALGGLTAMSLKSRHRFPVFTELGGLTVHGPTTTSELRERFGEGNVRVTAYLVTERRILWEVLTAM